ncbi:unnamed protein product [Amoebophrya sp. A25]|nr:unnamed protein product [Amoebophrya sp. A25]|eukprot:GSA25T00026946001.1
MLVAGSRKMDAEEAAASRRSFFQRRLLHDAGAAFGAAVGLSPFVAIIDKSIISNASGRQSLRDCLRENFALLLRRPHKFVALRELHLIYGVYSCTYLAANYTDTICREYGYSPVYPVFLATGAANMGCSVLKDRAFTRMFSAATKAPAPLPRLSYALFCARDLMTIFGSFTLVPFAGETYYEWINWRSSAPSSYSSSSSSSSPISTSSSAGPKLQTLPATGLAAMPAEPKSEEKISKFGSLTLAQLTCPMLIQIISTPLHLTALDLYNRPGHPFLSRATFVGSQYLGAMTLRMSRIAPAFGFGGVGNRALREYFNRGVVEEEKRLNQAKASKSR